LFEADSRLSPDGPKVAGPLGVPLSVVPRQSKNP
jgi:hypothetical protein